MRKNIALLISLLFLAYGLVRLGGGFAMLGQELGLLHLQDFDDPIGRIGAFLSESADRQLLPMSVAGYLGYGAVMGAVLSIGAIGTLKDMPFGLFLIGAFVAMYALLFVNFQAINPKLLHWAACVAMFGALLWLKGSRGAPTNP